MTRSDARSCARAAGFLLVAWSLAGCVSLGGTSSGRSASGSERPSDVAGGVEQALFRVRYSGIDGHGRLRLTLREAGDTFQVVAADPFGRSLWSFETSGSGTLLLDHRRAIYCRLEGDVSIDVVALSELPLRMLPRLLSGRLPFDPVPGHASPRKGEADLRDAAGRRWTARYEGGQLRGWTLWSEGEPILWWQRQGDGGILSHRDGAQAVWTRTVEERVPGELEPLEPPPTYSPGDCESGGDNGDSERGDGDDLA